MKEMGKKMVKGVESMKEKVESCDVEREIKKVV
jgi:hypothetical protein